MAVAVMNDFSAILPMIDAGVNTLSLSASGDNKEDFDSESASLSPSARKEFRINKQRESILSGLQQLAKKDVLTHRDVSLITDLREACKTLQMLESQMPHNDESHKIYHRIQTYLSSLHTLLLKNSSENSLMQEAKLTPAQILQRADQLLEALETKVPSMKQSVAGEGRQSAASEITLDVIKILVANPQSQMMRIASDLNTAVANATTPALSAPANQQKNSLVMLLTMLNKLLTQNMLTVIDRQGEIVQLNTEMQTETMKEKLKEQEELQRKQQEAAQSSAKCSKGFKIGLLVLGLVIGAITTAFAGPVGAVVSVAFMALSVVDFALEMTIGFSVMGKVMKPMLSLLEPMMAFFVNLTKDILMSCGASGAWVDTFSQIYGALVTFAFLVAGALIVKMGSSFIASKVASMFPQMNAVVTGVVNKAIAFIENGASKVTGLMKQGVKRVGNALAEQVAEVKTIIGKMMSRYATSSLRGSAMMEHVEQALSIMKNSLSTLKRGGAWLGRNPDAISLAATATGLAGQGIQLHYARIQADIEREKAKIESVLMLANMIMDIIMKCLKGDDDPMKNTIANQEALLAMASGVETSRIATNNTITQLI